MLEIESASRTWRRRSEQSGLTRNQISAQSLFLQKQEGKFPSWAQSSAEELTSAPPHSSLWVLGGRPSFPRTHAHPHLNIPFPLLESSLSGYKEQGRVPAATLSTAHYSEEKPCESVPGKDQKITIFPFREECRGRTGVFVFAASFFSPHFNAFSSNLFYLCSCLTCTSGVVILWFVVVFLVYWTADMMNFFSIGSQRHPSVCLWRREDLPV